MYAEQGNRWLIGLMMGLIVLTPMGVDIFLPSLPVMARDFGVDSTALRWSITLYLISMGLCQLLAGPLVDWLGRRRMALVGALLYALAALVAAMAERLDLFQVARGLQGVGAAIATVVAFACVRDRFSGERGAGVYSLLNAAVCVVPALAPLLGGVLASLWQWRASFVFMVLFALAVSLLCLWRQQETRPRHLRPQYPQFRPHTFAAILADRHFLFYALVAAIGMSVILTYVTTAPLLLIEQAGLSEIAFGAWFGGVAAINVAAYFVAPLLIRRLGQGGAIRLGLNIMVLGGVLHGLTMLAGFAGVAAFMLINALMATGFSFTLGAAMSLALAPHAGRAGSASALIGCFQMGGGALIASLMTLLPLPPQWLLMLLGVMGAGILRTAIEGLGEPAKVKKDVSM
ncbi:multidrug effflux MFS transporter [Kushneria aurantia]|uniref:Bcr/CflA family efflux transporter n=1 Tax=Kushneria aurantia TaxID=504092 RepID=A0ABV6G6H8_9GAMM|nr:multidrug effflux MFS transporter [Kushneria aurantia]